MKTSFIIIFLLLTINSFAQSAKIKLKCGDEINCIIVKESDQFVTYYFSDEPDKLKQLSRSNISEIQYSIKKIIPTISDSNRTEEYCLVLAKSKFLSTKIVITVDFGQERKAFKDNRYKDELGVVVNFNSIVDALNYMNSLGWQFVNAYVITVGNQNVYHYLMRRKFE